MKALHGFACKLGSDWMAGEWFIEVDQSGGRWNVPPVEEMIELREEEERMKQSDHDKVVDTTIKYRLNEVPRIIADINTCDRHNVA